MRRLQWLISFMVVMTATACTSSSSPSAQPADANRTVLCGTQPSRVCVEAIEGEDAWRAATAPLAGVDAERGTAFLAPRRDADGPVLFADAATLVAKSGSATSDALIQQLTTVVSTGADTGTLIERVEASLGTVYLYDVRDDEGWTCAAHEALHQRLLAAFKLRPLFRARLKPNDPWRVPPDCDVPTFISQISEIDYEAYTVGTSYGTVHALRTGEVAAAVSDGELGWRDILVLEQTPFDVESIIAGAITGTRQGQLSHLNIRSAARGTPNCYLRDAYDKLKSWEGKLVKVTCGAGALSIEEATLDDAEAWRQSFRPKPIAIAPPDESVLSLVNLLQIPTATRADRALAARRYGSKAANLAALYQRTDPALSLAGFAIPVAHYRRFLRDNMVAVTAAGVVRTMTLETFVRETLADPVFKESGKVRRDRLATVRAAFAAAACSRGLLEDIQTHAAMTARGAEGVWRFRSSSNAEDVAAFNGAGLYTSQSGCVADDLDSDEAGPSRCELDRKRERTACEALKAVWASMWQLRAYEERSWAGVSHEDAVMGVLVNEQSENERANMVVFSGDPTIRGDTRLLVDAQIGSLEVVAPEEGTWPETSRVTTGEGGVVTAIERVRRSSATAAGQTVLSDEQLRTLGGAYAAILAQFPKDSSAPEGKEVIYDSEWKVLADGRLVIKQIRPFIR